MAFPVDGTQKLVVLGSESIIYPRPPVNAPWQMADSGTVETVADKTSTGYCYAIRYHSKYVYIGSCQDFERRANQHSRLCSGSRRVVLFMVAVMSRGEEVDFVVLWKGECTLPYLRAMEQYFMEMHNTRCPSDASDTDLLTFEDDHVIQLNRNRSSTDTNLLQKIRSEHGVSGGVMVVSCSKCKDDLLQVGKEVREYSRDSHLFLFKLLGCIQKYSTEDSKSSTSAYNLSLEFTDMLTSCSAEKDGNATRSLVKRALLQFHPDRMKQAEVGIVLTSLQTLKRCWEEHHIETHPAITRKRKEREE